MKKLSEQGLAMFLVPTLMATRFLAVTIVITIPAIAFGKSYSTGNGSAGVLALSTTRTEDTTWGSSNINSAVSSGQNIVSVADGSQFSTGDMIFIIQMQGAGAGNYEFGRINSISGNFLVLNSSLSNSYAATGAQVIQVGEYSSVTVNSGGIWTASAWNGTKGGVLVAVSQGAITLLMGGEINMTARGFAGGPTGNQQGTQGFGTSGATPVYLMTSNGNGGGAGEAYGAPGPTGGGGGGGNGVAGTNGAEGSECYPGAPGAGGRGFGGGPGGEVTLQTAAMGGGAGSGGGNSNSVPQVDGFGGDGGYGGGIIFLVAGGNITLSGGTLQANGSGGGNGGPGSGTNETAGGGGGAGGSIRFVSTGTIALGTNIVNANGGSGGVASDLGCAGGTGASGRIATLAAASVTGVSNPIIDVTSLDTVIWPGAAITALGPSFSTVHVTSLTVTWASISGANYIAILATDSGFNNLISSTTEGSNTRTYTGLPSDTNLFFKVKLSTEADSAYSSNLISTRTLAFSPGAILTGKVTKSDGTTAISGATVEILQGGNLLAQTAADGSGNYSITVAAGAYDVRANASGYLSLTKIGISVTAGQTTIVNFALGTQPPPEITLGDNLFNPRAGGTSKVKFSVPEAGKVSLKIYDLSGRLIRTLFEGYSNPGDMQKDWDGRDDGGRYVAPSVYFLHYVYPGGKEVRKIGVKK